MKKEDESDFTAVPLVIMMIGFVLSMAILTWYLIFSPSAVAEKNYKSNGVMVNEVVGTLQDVGLESGTLQNKYTETKDGKDEYYFVIDDTIYSIGKEEYKSFQTGDYVKFQE